MLWVLCSTIRRRDLLQYDTNVDKISYTIIVPSTSKPALIILLWSDVYLEISCDPVVGPKVESGISRRPNYLGGYQLGQGDCSKLTVGMCYVGWDSWDVYGAWHVWSLHVTHHYFVCVKKYPLTISHCVIWSSQSTHPELTDPPPILQWLRFLPTLCLIHRGRAVNQGMRSSNENTKEDIGTRAMTWPSHLYSKWFLVALSPWTGVPRSNLRILTRGHQ